MVTFAAAFSRSHVGVDEPVLVPRANAFLPLAAEPHWGYALCRYDLAEVGRFAQRDPADPVGQHYVYAGNHPTDRVDPMGLDDYPYSRGTVLVGDIPPRGHESEEAAARRFARERGYDFGGYSPLGRGPTANESLSDAYKSDVRERIDRYFANLQSYDFYAFSHMAGLRDALLATIDKRSFSVLVHEGATNAEFHPGTSTLTLTTLPGQEKIESLIHEATHSALLGGGIEWMGDQGERGAYYVEKAVIQLASNLKIFEDAVKAGSSTRSMAAWAAARNMEPGIYTVAPYGRLSLSEWGKLSSVLGNFTLTPSTLSAEYSRVDSAKYAGPIAAAEATFPKSPSNPPR